MKWFMKHLWTGQIVEISEQIAYALLKVSTPGVVVYRQ